MAFLLAVARVIEPMVELGVELIETGVWATSFAGFKMGLDAMEGPMGDGDYWPKRSATATHSPTIYQVHNIGNLTIADMKVLNGMVAESQHHGDNTAIFRNEKMNWTAVGTMTGTQKEPSHGEMYGRFHVPLGGDRDAEAHGYWLYVDPSKASTPDAFAFGSVHKWLSSHPDEEDGYKHLMEMFDHIWKAETQHEKGGKDFDG